MIIESLKKAAHAAFFFYVIFSYFAKTTVTSMKKSIIGCLVLVGALLANSSFGQAQFSIGIKAGPNFANINTDASVGENYKNRTGFHGGAFALIKLTKIGIQPEVIFSQQGTTVELSGSSLQSNVNYMNIPVILKLYLIGGLNLQAGPQFGFVMSAEQENPLTGNFEDIKDDLKSSDISAGLGLGFDAPFGLTIDARYNLGLSEINDAQAQAIKNQVFQLSLGFKLIKLGK